MTADRPTRQPPASSAFATALADRNPEKDLLPSLPFELVEAILAFVPLRTPLSLCWGNSPNADAIHTEYAAAFAVVSPPTAFLELFLPRMHNGFFKLASSPISKDAKFLRHLHDYRFRAPYNAFEAALVQNRLDVLDWWVQAAQFPVFQLRNCCAKEHLVHYQAIKAQAWDALDWLAKTGDRNVCDDLLEDQDLADLLRTKGDRQVQFVQLWLKAGYLLIADYQHTIHAACELGLVHILDAWEQGYEQQGYDQSLEGPEHDEASSIAIRDKALRFRCSSGCLPVVGACSTWPRLQANVARLTGWNGGRPTKRPLILQSRTRSQTCLAADPMMTTTMAGTHPWISSRWTITGIGSVLTLPVITGMRMSLPGGRTT